MLADKDCIFSNPYSHNGSTFMPMVIGHVIEGQIDQHTYSFTSDGAVPSIAAE